MSAEGIFTEHSDAFDKENDAVAYPLKLWGADHLGSCFNDCRVCIEHRSQTAVIL